MAADVGPGAYGRAMSTTTTGLSELEDRILTFERGWYRYPGAKDQAAREAFGVSAVRYSQLLNALLDKPAALAAHPVLVKRLRRLRDERKAARNRR